jgi:hypothetical protein
MKWFKSYVVIILLLAILIIPSVTLAAWWNPFSWNQGNLFSAFVSTGWKTYTSTNYGFNIQYPSSWKIVFTNQNASSVDHVAVGFNTPYLVHGGKMPGASFFVHILNNEKKLSSYISGVKTILGTNTKIVEEGSVQIGGQDGYKIIGTSESIITNTASGKQVGTYKNRIIRFLQ